MSLIHKHEIDIYDIPIAELTKQYLEVISQSPPDMDGMSEFLLMAATLLEIKSRMLLPKHKSGDEEEDNDPREALVRQLVAYKHCQTLAKVLQGLPNAGVRLFKKPEYPLMANVVTFAPEDWLADVTTAGLRNVYLNVILRQARKVDTIRSGFKVVARERYTIDEKIDKITECLKDGRVLRLSVLFAECECKDECVVTFLALLELIRRSQAVVSQEDIFGEIEILSCQS